MKRLVNYIGLIGLIIAVLGCTDEKLFNSTDGDIRVTGTVDVPTRTSYSVGETAVSVSWAVNDEIGLLTEKQPAVLCYKATSDGKQTDFVPVNTTLGGTDGQDVYAYYPYEYNSNITYPYVPLPYIFGQNYRNGIPDPDTDFMYAKGQIRNGTLNLHFSHLFAYLKLNIRTELLKDAQGLFIRSSETIVPNTDGDGQEPYFNLKTEQIEGVKLDHMWYSIPAEVIQSQERITCYLTVCPTSEDNWITFYIHDKDGKTEQAILQRKAPKGGFQAGHVYDLTVDKMEFEDVTITQQKEREALVALYKATGGDNWKNNTNWCSDKPLNEWYGVGYWDGGVREINLSDNNLVGTIPTEIGNLIYLQQLYLGFNRLSGGLPESMADLHSLTSLNLSHNSLNGGVPESFAVCMDKLKEINLTGNLFSGRLPEAIVNHPKWKDLWNGFIGGGFDMTGVKLPAPDFMVTDINGNQISSAVEYANNKLTAVLHWWSSCPWSDMYMKEQLMPWYNLYHDKGFEIIGYSTEEMGSLRNYVEANEIPWKIFQYTSGNEIPQLYSSSTPTIYLIDQNKEIIFQSFTQNRNDMVQVLAEKLGAVELYTSTDYSRDGEVVQLQEATQGKGINLVFMGEAFVDKDMEPGGLYEQTMREAMEQYFAYEPLSTLRNRFNVFAVKVVSPNAEFTAEAEHRINEDLELCFDYAKKVPGQETAPNQMVSVIYNKGYSGRSYTFMLSLIHI